MFRGRDQIELDTKITKRPKFGLVEKNGRNKSLRKDKASWGTPKSFGTI